MMNMPHRLYGFLVASFGAVVSCAAEDVVSLGVNPETGLSEIRVNIAGLPEDATPLDMALVPAGTFTMGSPSDERGRWGWEWLPHVVTITEPFYLGKHEVTQAQWQAVMGSNRASGHGVGDDYPVYAVSWNDCQTFISRLNETGQGTFRLPTEAEWEYACRAGTTTRFSFGDALECDDSTGYCEIQDQYMWWGGNNGTVGSDTYRSKEVGLKLPNPWGLYDMHGNVWEWCSDWWQDSASRGPQTDPQGPTLGSYRASRGGDWHNNAQYCRSAFRNNGLPDDRVDIFGVRLLRLHEASAVSDWSAYE